MFPAYHQQPQTYPLGNLQNLPRLEIPSSHNQTNIGPLSADRSGYQTAFYNDFSAYRHAAAASPPTIDRFATPASDMDVPVTAIPMGPIVREVSQSVPPDMHFHNPVQRARVTSRRPSMPLPHINEDRVFSPEAEAASGGSTHRSSSTYGNSEELASSPKAVSDGDRTPNPNDYRYPNVNHHGWMKKRKTKLLRHEWHDHHFRLTGSRLAMHPDSLPSSAALDTLNIDEYAVACSSLASNKLAAKLKAFRIKDEAARNKEEAKFSFQLVPTTEKDGHEMGALKRAVAGAKTHHFAVRSRDERIDWMRELMLAKALKAKNDGYEVEVNGTLV
jgi:hypothetical protein